MNMRATEHSSPSGQRIGLSSKILDFNFITIHPALVETYRTFGVFASAEKHGLAIIKATNLRDYAVDKHGTVDDRPYGGGDGMVLRPEPLVAACAAAGEKPYVICLSPAGRVFTQSYAEELHHVAAERPLVFVCGRFSGIDQRFIDSHVDALISVGDYVLAGGELPALSIAEAVLRLVPGVLGHEDSAALDSFSPQLGGGLEHPVYTRPQSFEGQEVPAVLLSGDHKKIAAWRKEEGERLTRAFRPELAQF